MQFSSAKKLLASVKKLLASAKKLLLVWGFLLVCGVLSFTSAIVSASDLPKQVVHSILPEHHSSYARDKDKASFNLAQAVSDRTNEAFNLIIALLTPGSDLATGDPGARFEAVFGRAGNDTIYAYDAIANNNQNQNLDILFGDLFENSQAEFEIILNIQNTQQGGNPLLILERNIPSVGVDRFVLGDDIQPYYASSDPATLTTTNVLGLNEFALLYDFSPSQDIIQLNGRPEDYLLVDANGLRVEGIQQPFFGKALFSLQQGSPDFIAYILARPEVTLNLRSNYFQYVGTRPRQRPGARKIGQFGTTGIDLGLGAATDSSNNIYLAGSTSGPLQGNNQGLIDGWIAKYNSNGNQLWGRQIGTSNNDSAYNIVTDNAGNVYVVGGTSGNLFSSKQSRDQDAWVAKYDTNGNQLWTRQFGANLFGGFANNAFGLDVDAQGNVYASGISVKDNTRTDIFNFSVQDDSWVIKFDSNGNQQWFTQIGSFFFDESYDLAVDRDGNAYVSGWTQGLVKESDPARPALKYDAWLAKVNADGQLEWTQQFGSIDQGLDFAWSVSTDSQNNAYVTGWTTGNLTGQSTTPPTPPTSPTSYNMWLTKFNPDGNQVWVRQFGSPDDDGTFQSKMEIDSQDNIFVTGYSNGQLGRGARDGNYNAWVAKFNTEGTNNWIQQFGRRGRLDYGTALAVGNANQLYATGFTNFVATNNSGASSGAVDAWLAQLNATNGRLQRFSVSTTDNASLTTPPATVMSAEQPDAMPTVDASNKMVTDEKLPNGDYRINPAEGIKPISSSSNNRAAGGNTTLDYGQILSNLSALVDPNADNSLPKAIYDAVNNGNMKVSP